MTNSVQEAEYKPSNWDYFIPVGFLLGSILFWWGVFYGIHTYFKMSYWAIFGWFLIIAACITVLGIWLFADFMTSFNEEEDQKAAV